MQRIAILGAGGAGKTVLTRHLGELLGLPVTHLDQLRYQPDWTLVAEQAFTAAQRDLVAADAWIIDGNSLASLPIRAARADTIIVLNPHPLVCLTGILHRSLRYGRGQHRDGIYNRITPNVVKYVLSYRGQHLPKVLASVRDHGRHAELIHLTSRRAADQLICQIRTERSAGSL
ncbi:topology modulation protein [Actinoplanes sp. NPDC026619]|uniref:topology modulation protein n=1 Tax=Actinoplanes sp. NPDC026619 TaxID=3155798 RepID=UPI0033C25F11